ncbi:MAG: hypothetical protein GYA60_04395, partial [Candidatus Methanofastidiosa archaeon]|nr:hypothetical protein [Candidatus Methanofastidiosa archaeon]
MKKKNKYKSIILALVFLISILTTSISAEETRETFCYNVPDTVRSLSIVENGYFTAAAGVGENPDIFIYDLDGVKWA